MAYMCGGFPPFLVSITDIVWWFSSLFGEHHWPLVVVFLPFWWASLTSYGGFPPFLVSTTDIVWWFSSHLGEHHWHCVVVFLPFWWAPLTSCGLALFHSKTCPRDSDFNLDNFCFKSSMLLVTSGNRALCWAAIVFQASFFFFCSYCSLFVVRPVHL